MATSKMNVRGFHKKVLEFKHFRFHWTFSPKPPDLGAKERGHLWKRKEILKCDCLGSRKFQTFCTGLLSLWIESLDIFWFSKMFSFGLGIFKTDFQQNFLKHLFHFVPIIFSSKRMIETGTSYLQDPRLWSFWSYYIRQQRQSHTFFG